MLLMALKQALCDTRKNRSNVTEIVYHTVLGAAGGMTSVGKVIVDESVRSNESE